MGARILRRSLFVIFSLLLISDSSFGKKPPLKAVRQDKKLDLQENQMLSSSSEITSQLDTIPVINPTTPTSSTPIINPTNPPPVNTAPIVNPPSPPSPIPTLPIPPSPIPTLPVPPPKTNTPASSGGSWCTASSTASDTALQVALDYACGYGGADCSAIQLGSTCYNPTTLRDHASYAFNAYYQKNPAPTSCSFGGTAQLTPTDPSSGSCRYASSRSIPSPSPPVMPPPTPPSASTGYGNIPSAPTGYGNIPSAPTGYGNIPSTPSIYNQPTGYEPTATPSSAETMSCSILLFFIATCVTASFAAAKYP